MKRWLLVLLFNFAHADVKSAHLRDIMLGTIDPSADVLWSSSGTIIDKDGVHELAPSSAEDWQKLSVAAKQLREGAARLITGFSKVAPEGHRSEAPGIELEPKEIEKLIGKRRPEFNKLARALDQVAAQFESAIVNKNKMALLDLGERLEHACESCHSTFWYPNQGPSLPWPSRKRGRSSLERGSASFLISDK